VPEEPKNGRERAAGRAARTVAAWRGNGREGYARRTRHGEVHLAAVQEVTTDSGVPAVEVWVAGETEGGDPHFIIVNPPGLAEDPLGPVEVGGRRFREDPLAALAEVVALHGGARTQKRKRRTQG
jgi:hypothetical protein